MSDSLVVQKLKKFPIAEPKSGFLFRHNAIVAELHHIPHCLLTLFQSLASDL